MVKQWRRKRKNWDILLVFDFASLAAQTIARFLSKFEHDCQRNMEESTPNISQISPFVRSQGADKLTKNETTEVSPFSPMY